MIPVDYGSGSWYIYGDRSLAAEEHHIIFNLINEKMNPLIFLVSQASSECASIGVYAMQDTVQREILNKKGGTKKR